MIGERFGIDLKTTNVVGDTPRDLQAAIAVGCQPHLVLTGKAEGLRDAVAKGERLPEAIPTTPWSTRTWLPSPTGWSAGPPPPRATS
jgi:ribonucleotide monophosphatase NagD (HAD superfamily)